MSGDLRVSSWQVTGMTCEHCAASVGEELGSLPGVRDVAVDLATGRVEVSSDQPLDRAAVEAAVAEAGYALT